MGQGAICGEDSHKSLAIRLELGGLAHIPFRANKIGSFAMQFASVLFTVLSPRAGRWEGTCFHSAHNMQMSLCYSPNYSFP